VNELPIGIFDSGVGGLTVYRALHDRLPNEHFVYLGDTARVPYGTKSLATVERYAIENSEFLASLGIKLLVVACNTASALALPKIRERIGLDVVGVIGPAGEGGCRNVGRNRSTHRGYRDRGDRVEQRICRGDPSSIGDGECVSGRVSAVCAVGRRRLDRGAGDSFDRRKISAIGARV
jgi:hypothetical protein